METNGRSAWVPRTALVLAYPGFTAFDLFGPQYFLAALPGMALQVVARTRDPVPGDAGATVVPAHISPTRRRSAISSSCPGGPRPDRRQHLHRLARARRRRAAARAAGVTAE